MADNRTVSIGTVDPRTPAIVTLIQELDEYLGPLYPAESNHLVDIDALAKPNVRFLAAKVDGLYKACGAIMIQGKDYAEVKRVYCSPTARGLGLGRRILVALEAEARKEGLKLMRLETGNLQPEALGLFEAEGFVRRGAFGDYPADDPHSVFMEKRL